MAPAPNSNLVFDFPDATPRFEFSDSSPTKNNGIWKNGKPKLKKGFGSKNKINSCIGSSGKSGSGVNGASSVNGNDIVGNGSGAINNCAIYGGGGSGEQIAMYEFDNENTTNKPITSHNRTPSYVSEVSEFSFDRVTVTTAETPYTNASSNVSWNFFEEMDAVTNDAAGNGGNQQFVPYTGEYGVDESLVSAGGNYHGRKVENRHRNIANSSDNHRSPSTRHERHTSLRSGGNNSKVDTAFDNISLSDCDSENNIPITGVISDNVSAISEISGELDEIQDKSLREQFMEGWKRAEKRHQSSQPKKAEQRSQSVLPDRKSQSYNGGSSMVNSPVRKYKGRNIVDSNLGNENGKAKTFLDDIKESYNEFKRNRSCRKNNISSNNSQVQQGSINQNKSFNPNNEQEDKNLFQSLLEDIYFCGWYFCGIDTTKSNDSKW